MKHIKIKAYCLLLIMVCNVLAPIPGWALSGGNKAPEFESFQPFGLDNMVDPATGDFSYNIPLMNVGFHGINLGYQAGVTMDQEATMVGLGWNINSGMINRTVRGIPDDFKGDEIVKKMSTKPYTTIGYSPGTEIELFGFDGLGLGANLGVSLNSYDGIGFEYSISPSLNIMKFGDNALTAGFGLSASSDGGVNLSPNISFDVKNKEEGKKGRTSAFRIGTSINSKGGLTSLSLSTNLLTSGNGIINKSVSGGISFAKPSFTPEISFPRKNTGFSLEYSAGPSLTGAYPEGKIRGYFSSQYIENKRINVKAYGLLYHENCPADGLQDFHHSKDLPQSEDVPTLAVPQLDFDTYSISGPGIMGSMQLDRGDLGLVHDRVQNTSSYDVDAGVELGAGALGHIGGDLTVNRSTQESKKWTAANNLNSVLGFKNNGVNNHNFEKAIFNKKDVPNIEINGTNDLFNQINKKDALRAKLSSIGGLDFKVENSVLSYSSNNSFDLGNKSGKRTSRIKRQNNITYKTFDEAIQNGYSKYLFGSTNFFASKKANIESIYNTNIGHHIAEIIVESEDGYKYIYGLPLFNLSQVDEVFAIDNDDVNNSLSSGLVNYNNGVDNSTGNNNGYDHYYTHTKVPAYVSSYVLTAIVSSDYQDITNDGPTADDYGSFVRFDYKTPTAFNWKTPTSKMPPNPNVSAKTPQASIDIGFLSKSDDSKASIVYGVREQTCPLSINDKTEIAVYTYYLDQRKDGWGEGVDGTIDRSTIPALRSITKYSFDDYNNNSSTATKLKSVHFEYNYDLCKGISNGETGKLTLKKLFILNGESTKGRFSPYEFDYNFNPGYQPKAINRFSGYQPRIIGQYADSPPTSTDLNTVNFPYVPQSNRAWQDDYASAWNLSKISLPSGGEIHVEYEADDYAFVQDKRAMQMHKILGFSTSPSSAISSSLDGNYLHFEIEDQEFLDLLNAPNANQQELLEDYLIRDIKDGWLYFKVKGTLNANSVQEFVPGWAQIEDFGRNGDKGWVKLKSTCLNERKFYNCQVDVNPIRKTLMQALRLNLPDILYGTSPGSQPTSAGVSVIVNSILALTSLYTQITQFTVGINNWMHGLNYGNSINTDQSFIRLYSPSRMKISGTHRVRSIVMVDNFEGMTSSVHSNGIYGKRYNYTTTDTDGATLISSGVAAYEPIVGGEENPFFQPIAFKEELLFAPDNTKYVEEPMMEDYFPSPVIIYSKVTTKDLYSPTGNYQSNAATFESKFIDLTIYTNTGFFENHFYTYKDYPIETIRTDKYHGTPYKSPRTIEFLNLFVKDKFTAVQGYYIYDPAMHGKPKANYTYNSSGQRISGQEQYYKIIGQKLDENVKVLTKTSFGTAIVDGRMGLEYSLFGSSREVRSKMNTIGVGLQVDLQPPIAFPIPTGYPSFADIEKRFRSLVLVKTIRQHGVLHKTVAINGASEIVTEHLLWDAETAQPIVSKTTNEFEDPIYQINLPAHLAYSNMGLSYQNSAANFSNVDATNGLVTNNQSLISAAVVGDKVSIKNGSSYAEAWVLRKSATSIFLIDEYGAPVSFNNQNIKIIESGYTNQGSASIASYITRENPIVGNNLVIDESMRIIDASATTFKDHWQTFCAFEKVDAKNCQCTWIKNNIEPLATSITNKIIENGANNFSGQMVNSEYNFISNNLNCSLQNKYTYNVTGNNQVELVHGINDCACTTIATFSPSLPSFNNIISINFNEGLHLATSSCDSRTALIPNIKVFYNGEEGESSYFNSSLSLETSCIDIMRCVEINSQQICSTNSGITNPFLRNILGNWRPEKSYVFQTDRSSTNDIQTDGSYATIQNNYNNTFINFWQQGVNGLDPNPGKWTWTNQNTMVSPIGMELEARDPLNRYSAELSGYNNTKVVAVAANARYNEIAYYGAEIPLANGVDIYGLNQPSTSSLNSCRPKYHFTSVHGQRVHYKQKLPNSGEYSLKFGAGKNRVLTFETKPTQPEICSDNTAGPYEINACDCIPKFKPTQGKKYHLSAWLNHSCLQDDRCNNPPYIQVKSGNHTFKINKYGPLIEGWRKVEGTFEIVVGDNDGLITVEGYGTSVYLDDIRIHPYHASMKTYNYDLKTLRFTFEHDDNNYFTRYDYADDGTLQRISKQTAKGVQTLQESTFSQQKAY